METKVKQKRIDEAQFLKMRNEVLSLWPTGKEVNLEEAIEYQKGLPGNKSFMKVTQKLKKEGKSVIFPRAGTPILEDEIKLCRALTESGIPFIPVTTDSYTRTLKFKKVQEALEESVRTGRPMLNGYPIINHGVKNTRKVVESCPGAFNPRISMSAQGLGAEIAFASGMTAFSAEPFFYFGSYEKTATLEDAIKATQYTYRLMGYYAERGPIISTDLHGWLPNGIFPLSVNIVTIIADALIAAEQGVKSVIPLVSFEGYMAQDLAWAKAEPKLVREYLDKLGYKDVTIPGLFVSQLPLYPAPQDLGEAFAYINYSAMVGALAQAECVSLRTVDEAAGIASTEAHALTYRSGNWLLEIMRSQKIEIEMKEIEMEEKLTEMEVRAILDKVLDMGDGDIAVGAIKGVEAGIIDSPFCPNRNARDKVLGVKDNKGACRYAEFGNLPIPNEAKEFHRKKIREREKAEGRKMDYMVAVEDLWAFSKGKMLGKPHPT